MTWLFEDLLGRAAFNDCPEIEHHDPVSDQAHRPQIVRDEQVGHLTALTQFGEQVEDFRAHRQIERTRGLIEHHQARFGHQRTGQRHALQLAARKLRRKAVKERAAQSYPLGGGVDAGVTLGAREGRVELERFFKHGSDPHARIDGRPRVLKHHLHLGPQPPQR